MEGAEHPPGKKRNAGMNDDLASGLGGRADFEGLSQGMREELRMFEARFSRKMLLHTVIIIATILLTKPLPLDFIAMMLGMATR